MQSTLDQQCMMQKEQDEQEQRQRQRQQEQQLALLFDDDPLEDQPSSAAQPIGAIPNAQQPPFPLDAQAAQPDV